MIKAAVSLVWYDNPVEIQGEYGPFQYGLNHSYAALLDRPDLLPLAVLPNGSISPLDILRNFDFLVLTGGGDPSPSLFGREDSGSRNPRPFRSSWDIKLYHAARELDIPVLGICLGMQILGIAEGAALIQDIPDTGVFHDGSALKPVSHPVDTQSGSHINSLFGDHAIVSSSHHQALEQVPQGYLVSARSNDGLIEAIESTNGRAIGVQWHPERDTTGEAIIDLMMKLVGN